MSVFVSDGARTGSVYAQLVRAPRVAGLLLNIDIPSLPDGYSFYTAAHIPGCNAVQCGENTVPVFAHGEVVYAGEPVGILIGPDEHVVRNLVQDVVVHTCAERACASEILCGISEGEPLAQKVAVQGDAETAFKRASHTVCSSCTFEPRVHYFAEMPEVQALPDAHGLHVYAATQWPAHMRKTIAQVLNISEHAVHVHPQQEALSCDGRIWFPSVMASQAALAAYCAKKPVRLSFSFQEYVQYCPKTPKITIAHRTALNAAHAVEGMFVFISLDAGAGNLLIDRMVAHMVHTALGNYAIPRYRIECTAFRSNVGLTDVFNGWADAYTSNALEMHINQLCAELHIFPDEWRVAHMKDTRETQRFAQLLAYLCEEGDFRRKHAAFSMVNAARKAHDTHAWRGIGLALGFQYDPSAMLARSGFSYVLQMTLHTDARIVVHSVPLSDSFKRVVVAFLIREFTCLEDAIFFKSSDEAYGVDLLGPSVESVGMRVFARLVRKCVRAIQRQRFRKPLPITVQGSFNTAKKGQVYQVVTVAKSDVSVPDAQSEQCASKVPVTADTSGKCEDMNGFTKMHGMSTHTPAACIIELELDALCVQPKIVRLWFVCDPGYVFCEKDVYRTVSRSITRALSHVSVEKIWERARTPEYVIIDPSDTPPYHVTLLSSNAAARAVGTVAEGIVPAAYYAALRKIFPISQNATHKVPFVARDIFYEMFSLSADDSL